MYLIVCFVCLFPYLSTTSLLWKVYLWFLCPSFMLRKLDFIYLERRFKSQKFLLPDRPKYLVLYPCHLLVSSRGTYNLFPFFTSYCIGEGGGWQFEPCDAKISEKCLLQSLTNEQGKTDFFCRLYYKFP